MQPQQNILLNKNQQQPQVIIFSIILNGVMSEVKINKQIWQVGNEIKINIIDMIGLKLKQKSEQKRKYTLYYYPRRKKMLKSIQRYVQQFDFQIKNSDIKNWIYNRKLPCSLKLLIYFNPVSGSNSLVHLNRALNFIKYTNFQPQVVKTDYRNHCLDHLRNQTTDDYCGVVIVSGDGLMHQFVNSFCQIPVSHVPAGSGNAFAKTQTDFAGELCKAQQSIYLVIKNRPKEFNLVKYQLEKINQPIYSFLSLEWAIVADLDTSSQSLRCLGALRFQVYAAYLILKLKRYRAKISYSTIQHKIPSFEVNLDNDPNYLAIQDDLSHLMFFNIPYVSQKHKFAPLIKLDDHFIDMQLISHLTSRYQVAKYLISSESGSHFDLVQEQPARGFQFTHRKITSFRLQPHQGGSRINYCIDGEIYQQQKLQASLSDKTFKAFV